MEKNVALAGALTAAFGAGIHVGWNMCRKEANKRIGKQKLAVNILETVLTRAIEDDCTPNEVRAMLVNEAKFLKLIGKV
jgi:hypothetical protein